MAAVLKPRTTLILLLLVGLVIRLSIMFPVYHGDMFNHMEWGRRALHYGLNGIYDLEINLQTAYHINQPPGTIYIFAGVRWLYEQVGNLFIVNNHQVAILPGRLYPLYEERFYPVMLKLPAILADIGLALLIYKFAGLYTTKKRALIGAAAYLFNPITIYNSAWWGQTDATVNFFGLLAFYLLLKKRLLPATFAIAASLFIKASLLIFVPFFLVIAWKQKYPIKQLALTCILPIIVVWVVTLPFHNFNDPLWLLRIYNDTVISETLSNVTENAFNLWALIYGIWPQTPGNVHLYGLTVIFWSRLLMAESTIAILYYLLKKTTVERLLISLVLIAFCSFLFLIGMHERYLFPIFPPLAVLVALRLDYFWMLVPAAIIHLLNLYNLWWAPNISLLRQILELPPTEPILITTLFIVFGLFIYQSLKWSVKIPQHEIN